MSIATALTALADDVSAAKAAITAKGGTAPNGTADMADAIAAIPSGGITPSGNINITDTNVTDVTNYATATVVDADLVASNIKEGVNILGILGTFAGGGGLQPIGTATTNPSGGSGYGQISIPANDGIFLLTNVSVTPNNTNRLPWAMIAWIDTTTPAQNGVAFQFNHAGYNFSASAIRQVDGMLQIDGASAYRFGTSATYDLYKLY